MDAEKERIFREYESLLDNQYKEKPFWSVSKSTAAYGVLLVPDMVITTLMLSPTPPVFTGAMAQRIKYVEEGVTQALRWISEEGSLKVTSSDSEQITVDALEFVFFSADYVQISDFHVMYGRGMIDVDLDQATRTVTFLNKKPKGMSDTLSWHESTKFQSNRGLDSAISMKPEDSKRFHQEVSKIKHRFENGRLVLDDLTDDVYKSVSGIATNIKSLESVPIPAGTDLKGFTIDEFWLFVSGLSTWSHTALSKSISALRNRRPPHECMPTQIVEYSYFQSQINRLTGLNKQTINNICDRMTYQPGPKSDYQLTPLIRFEDKIAWSPATIMCVRFERNLIKQSVRGNKLLRNHFATINGDRDRPLARCVADIFRKKGFQFKYDTNISFEDDSTDVDILLWTAKFPNEILVVECKAIVAADEINEIKDLSTSIEYGQNQVLRIQKILNGLSLEEKERKFKFVPWKDIKAVFGIVVTSDNDPPSTISNQTVPAISLPTLKTRLRSSDLSKPSRVFTACKDRPWLELEAKEGDLVYQDIQMQDLTYRLPGFEMELSASAVNAPKIKALMNKKR